MLETFEILEGVAFDVSLERIEASPYAGHFASERAVSAGQHLVWRTDPAAKRIGRRNHTADTGE